MFGRYDRTRPLETGHTASTGVHGIARVRDHLRAMSDETPPDVLGSLPRSRPHRRSDKRVARPETGETARSQPEPAAAAERKPATAAKRKPAAAAERKPAAAAKRKPAAAKPKPTAVRRPRRPPLAQPAQPTGAPGGPSRKQASQPRRSPPPSGADLLGTAVQAAAEIAEIGLSVSARAIRTAVSKLPRP